MGTGGVGFPSHLTTWLPVYLPVSFFRGLVRSTLSLSSLILRSSLKSPPLPRGNRQKRTTSLGRATPARYPDYKKTAKKPPPRFPGIATIPLSHYLDLVATPPLPLALCYHRYRGSGSHPYRQAVREPPPRIPISNKVSYYGGRE
ncbi:hypothetical protein ES708_16681 [subsurface metagenome]